MSASLSLSDDAAPFEPATRKIAPIWRAAGAAVSLVAHPAMACGEVSAAPILAEHRPAGFRMAAVAAGAAFAGSAVGLAYFLSRKPTGLTGDCHAKFRA